MQLLFLYICIYTFIYEFIFMYRKFVFDDDDDCPHLSCSQRRKKRGDVKGECERIRGEEEERKADYEGTVQPSQYNVAPCVKRVEWGLGMRGLRIVAAFWAGNPQFLQPRL